MRASSKFGSMGGSGIEEAIGFRGEMVEEQGVRPLAPAKDRGRLAGIDGTGKEESASSKGREFGCGENDEEEEDVSIKRAGIGVRENDEEEGRVKTGGIDARQDDEDDEGVSI